jgi:Cu+-exporting ATPase
MTAGNIRPGQLAIAVATYSLTGDVMHSITVLVVICPCSLVLAKPTAVVAAIGNAAKRGVRVEHGLALCKAPVEQPGRCASSI